MKTKTKSEIAVCIALGIILTITSGFTGCAWWEKNGGAVLAGEQAIANIALAAVPAQYQSKAQAAQAGLDALAAVIQSYKGQSIPQAIVAASPGIAALGTAIAPLVSSNKIVSQADANIVYAAAAIAGKTQ